MTTLNKPVVRLTQRPFDNFGPDRERRYVVTLCPGDLITLRPHRCRRPGCEIRVMLSSIYKMALINRANSAHLEKARAVKKKKAEARERRRFIRSIREDAK